MPLGTRRVHNLRRRLAAVFFFDDVEKARQKPKTHYTIRAVIDRLQTETFEISAGTDYEDLAAMIKLLDLVVDEGGRQWVAGDKEEHFNVEVDDLIRQLKMVFRKIDISGASHLAKLVSRTLLEILDGRLSYSVRTKRRPKMDIFDRLTRVKEDTSIPAQRDFMTKFVKTTFPR